MNTNKNTNKPSTVRGSVFILGISSAEIFYLPCENAIFSAITPPAKRTETFPITVQVKRETKGV